MSTVTSTGPPPFTSVLFDDDVPLDVLAHARQPDFFRDLTLDKLVTAVCARHDAESLLPYFWVPLRTVASVEYRQQAMIDCARPDVNQAVRRFLAGYEVLRQQRKLREQVRYRLQKERCLLDAAAAYCVSTARLAKDLAGVELRSAAMQALARHVTALVESQPFRELTTDVDRVRQALNSVTYLLRIHSRRIQVDRYEEQLDMGHHVAELFARFRQHGRPEDRVVYRGGGGFSHIDAAVLGHVALLFPSEFGMLHEFSERHAAFADTVMARFGREAEFILAWLEFVDQMRERGLDMCFPEVRDERRLLARDSFDAALASISSSRDIVPNTFDVSGDEWFIVITGPNQGGKTTAARCFGQLHHLAALGCPVPAAEAIIPLSDQIFVQFERQEDPGSQRGKLQDDLIRMHAICESATEKSVVVLNEVFSSTSTDDAIALARRIFDKLLDRGCLGLCVTFLDELAAYRPDIVSMVAEVDLDDPTVRTYRLTSRPADGRAYAEAIARKYRLTRDEVKRRVAP